MFQDKPVSIARTITQHSESDLEIAALLAAGAGERERLEKQCRAFNVENGIAAVELLIENGVDLDSECQDKPSIAELLEFHTLTDGKYRVVNAVTGFVSDEPMPFQKCQRIVGDSLELQIESAN